MNGHSKPILKLHHSKHRRSPSSLRLAQLWAKGRSLVRVVGALLIVAILLTTIHQYFSSEAVVDILEAEEIVLENCAGIEPLRRADECFEAFETVRGRRKQPQRHIRQQSTHLENEENIPWVSSYGVVLDYDAAYDRLAPGSDEELYSTKRTLKCHTGFHMSIVWDIEFSTPLISAYKNGLFGLSPNSSNEIATSCPSLEYESSASMSIKINCGFDIKRDGWGHPADEQDHAELETCVRMAWSWVKGRVGDQYVAPWRDLCHENEFGELHCDREVFHVEGAD